MMIIWLGITLPNEIWETTRIVVQTTLAQTQHLVIYLGRQ